VRVRHLELPHLPQLLELVNVHLGAVVPGWALTGGFLAETLQRNFAEYITDPWVAERATLCAVEGHRVLAAAHLLRYGSGPELSDSYRGRAEVDWFLGLPGRDDAASAAPATTSQPGRTARHSTVDRSTTSPSRENHPSPASRSGARPARTAPGSRPYSTVGSWVTAKSTQTSPTAEHFPL
jgi:hypothetical protein